MSIKPILFNTNMVRAILDGRKTVTRRVVKPQPKEELAYIWGGSNHGKWCYSPYNKSNYEKHRTANDWKYWTPPCHADDILWVRENFCNEGNQVAYKADWSVLSQNAKASCAKPMWKRASHMPREAARIFLRVTAVRVERLQKMDDTDVLAEGFTNPGDFIRFWDKTIKPADREDYGWAANPLVWVITFERCEKPEGF